MRRAMLLATAVMCCLSSSAVTGATNRPMTPCDYWMTPTYDGGDPRLHLETINGRDVYVLVPTDYDQTSRRYPVIYLIHGGLNDHHAYPTSTDIISFASGQPVERHAIVVMPDGTAAPVWSDWRNGALQDEILFLEHIVPFIDQNYRTIADRSHRAIAGFSAGALGASILAARHPDFFVALASFSGLLNIDTERGSSGLGGAGLVYAGGTLYGYCYGDPSKIDPFGLYGDPINDPVWIRNGNPSELGSNLGATSVTIYSGNGQPCDQDDLEILLSHATTAGPESPPWGFVEAGARSQTQDFSAALTQAGVKHSFDDYGCGIHSYRYVERDIHAWWTVASDAFGSPDPESFDYKGADATLAVWDWTFEADPARAPEFLQITDASANGLTLTGSGVETVTTAAYFQPGSVVSLTGAVEEIAVADAAGRIMFHVDLGPAHPQQQYTLQARIAEAAAGGTYFTSRTVRFA